MKAVILAAGQGNRLRDAGREQPKCLLRFAGETLLGRMLRDLAALDLEPILVVGYLADRVREEVDRTARGAPIRFVENPEYRGGNLLSAWEAREHLSGPVLLMDADVLYHPDILRRLVASPHANCFLLDRHFEPGEEPTHVAVDGGRVTDFRRDIREPHDLIGESVGFFKFSAEAAADLVRTMGAFVAGGRRDASYDDALRELLPRHRFGAEEVTGLPWIEIDFPEDVTVAARLAAAVDAARGGAAMREFVLLNPGPANTTETVRRALVTPDLCHREEEFFAVMREVRGALVRLAGGEGTHRAVMVTGSGTAAVEATICSVVEEGRTLLVVDNGVYGDRMRRIAEAHRIPHQVLKGEWTEPPRLADLDAALREHPEISHVAIVHHETTTGLLNPLGAVGELVARHRRGLIVDAMSSFAGEPLHVGGDRVDFLVSSANKCLQAMPGLSFVIGARTALEGLQERRPRSVYLDLGTLYALQERDDTPFTPAIQVFFALRQALRELEVETLAGRQRRYRECARRLREGMEALGFQILVPPEHRSSTVTAFRLPKGVTYRELHDAFKARGFIIYAGQGPLREHAFRVANMGTLTPADMDRVLAAFREVLAERGLARVTV